MDAYTLPELFQLNISAQAHIQAQNFCRYQSQANKAKQVYFNTLAVSIGRAYLNLIGWCTSLEGSDSWNPITQSIMNTADLYLPSYGRLECRAVLSGEQEVNFPPEVWSNRIGYLVIMLENSLQTAKIVGFLRQVGQQQVALTQIEPLADFPAYLSRQKKIETRTSTDLSSWISGTLTHGWQRLDKLFSSPAIVFRTKQELASSTTNAAASRVKLIDIGRDAQYTIAIVMQICSLSAREFNISLIVCSDRARRYLPEGLELAIIDRVGYPVMTARANHSETIEFCFSGERKENFALEISLADHSLVENFII